MPNLFLNEFTVLDVAIMDPNTGMSGASYYVSAELFGHLDHQDFVLDFALAKRALKTIVDEALDHKLLVPQVSEVNIRNESNEEIQINLQAKDSSRWQYLCPRQAVEFFAGPKITSTCIEDFLAKQALKQLPESIKEVRFFLSDAHQASQQIRFSYTHGLRLHEGNCQRLFHGHKSFIQVWIDGTPSKFWESKLAAEWNQAHFASEATLSNIGTFKPLLGVRTPTALGEIGLRYKSAQGVFFARLPASRLLLVDGEPTIERMAMLAVKTLRRLGLESRFRVVVSEGLNKGAAINSEDL